MSSRRDRLAQTLQRLGFLDALESVARRRHLVVLAYHRIGEAGSTEFDPALFSATAEEFDWQVSHLKRRFGISSLDEALTWLESPSKGPAPGVVITFDDGYRDNFDWAFPVLQSRGVEGTFFVATSFVGTNKIPWWDRLAYSVKHTKVPVLMLTQPRSLEFDTSSIGKLGTLRSLLRLYKSPEVSNGADFLRGVEEACGVRVSDDAERLFMTWHEAAMMLAGGMRIQSHTHSHEIMSKLPLAVQEEELRVSRAVIKQELGIDADVLAYPVGRRGAFSADSYRALERAGYRCAFSYFGGSNAAGDTDRFNIRRIPVDSDLQRPLFRLRTASSMLLGREMF